MERMWRGAGVVGFALLANACGGHVEVGGGPEADSGVVGFDSALPDSGHPEPDSGFEDWLPPPDSGACGSGPCSPGYTCAIPCGSCSCVAGGGWVCSGGTDCYDSGPYPDAYPTCPPYEPFDGQYCGGDEGLSCTWPSSCGTSDYGYCSGGRWSVKRETCPSGCPTTRPMAGTSCASTAPFPYCKYPSACGGVDLAYCTTGVWEYGPSDCPPPPPCPYALPPDGSYCPVDKQECDYANACGTTDYAVCIGGGWRVKPTCTGGSCPVYEPVSGASCTTPSATMCSYPTPYGCSTDCFCAKDFRWACYDPPCYPPPPDYDGGFVDAGGYEAY